MSEEFPQPQVDIPIPKLPIKRFIISFLGILAVGFVGAVFLSNVSKNTSEPSQQTIQENTVTPEELGYTLRADFEEGVFPDAWKGSYEIVNLERALAVSPDAEKGTYAAKFTVASGDLIKGKSRAELAWDNHNAEGVEELYLWNVKIPENYQDVPLIAKDGRPNWQVIGQWHDQPDVTKGETWDSYPAHSSSLALNYGFLTQNDPEYKRIIASGIGDSIVGFSPDYDNQPMISVTYGTPPQPIALYPIQKGVWNTVTAHVLWSQTEKGFAEVSINGMSVTGGKHFGVNKYNAASAYFKFGLYRHEDIPYTNSIFYDNVRIERVKQNQ